MIYRVAVKCSCFVIGVLCVAACQRPAGSTYTDEYECITLRKYWNYLLQLHDIVETDNRVCLMCFEKDPRQCHRTRVAKALMSLPQHKYKLNEIFL